MANYELRHTLLNRTVGFAIAQFGGTRSDLLAGGIAQILVPAASLVMTYYFDDSEGLIQWTKNTAATLVATEYLKYSLDKTFLGKRPNCANRAFHPAIRARLVRGRSSWPTDMAGNTLHRVWSSLRSPATAEWTREFIVGGT